MRFMWLAASLLAPVPALAQSVEVRPSLTLFERPGYVGGSVTLTEGAPDLGARRLPAGVQSAQAVGRWQLCPEAGYRGDCLTLAGDIMLLRPVRVASARPIATGQADIGSLEPGGGVEGLEVVFFPDPRLDGDPVAASPDALAAAEAFCRLAGLSRAIHAGRDVFAAAGAIAIGSGERVHQPPLRDVLCRR